MNKKEFITSLNEKLYFLVDVERNKEISKYEQVIDGYINMGQDEKTAVENLGDFDDLVLAIYLSHGLDYNKFRSGKLTGKGFIAAFKNFTGILSSQDKKNARNALFYIFYLIVMVILLKVVFIFVRDMLSQLFNGAFSTSKTLDTVYTLTFNVLYFAASLLLFIKLFVKKFGKN